MTESLRQIFESRRQDTFNPLLSGIQGTYRFDIEGAGKWRAIVNDGHFHMEESAEPAQCVIEANEQDFTAIMQGRQNLVTAAMQGRVNVSGDIALAQKFHGFVGARVEEQSQSGRPS